MICNPQKHLLLRWVGWFFFINILFSFVIQATYLLIMPSLSAVFGATPGNIVLAYFFLIVSYVAHATILNAFAAAFVLIVAWFIPRKPFIFSVATLFGLVLLIAQVVDRFAYRLYHAHQFSIGMAVIRSGAIGEVMPLSRLEYIFLILIMLVIIIVELCAAWLVWRRLLAATPTRFRTGYKVSAILLGCIAVSYSLMAFVVTVPERYRFDDARSHLLLKMARLVPYYQDVYSWLIPGSYVSKHIWHTEHSSVILPTTQVNRPLDYPLHPLQCLPPRKKPNIVFLVFDTLRYDALNPTVMPHMSQFAKQTVQFDNVFSGGNCTQPGVFSLFYGIPANYWNATVAQRKSPVLINELQKSDYQLGIFASASLLFPQFEDNIFASVKHYHVETPGNTSKARDEKITQLFNHFIYHRNRARPFFSFIFYDSVHNYCEGSANEFMGPFKPAIAECARFSLTKNTPRTPYINRYHNAAYFLDQQAAHVIATLRHQHLLKNTIIIITADHGEQHNDQHMNYWSHASAYTPYQLHIPMLVYWPGIHPQHRDYFVTNFDVVPTLLQHVLNCKNPVRDYSVGKSLFSNGSRPYLISGSYTDYAYVTHKQITRVYPGGDYVINGPLGHHQDHVQLNAPLLTQAAKELTRYFRHD